MPTGNLSEPALRVRMFALAAAARRLQFIPAGRSDQDVAPPRLVLPNKDHIAARPRRCTSWITSLTDKSGERSAGRFPTPSRILVTFHLS